MDITALETVDRVPHGGATADDVIDFSANTNPRQPPGIKAVYQDAFEATKRYADDHYEDFRKAAAAHIDADCASTAVIPTAGGLAGLRLALASTVSPGDSVVVPVPSFGEYIREVRLHGGTPRTVAAAQLLDTDPTDDAVAIVCQPNNPTGRMYAAKALDTFVSRCQKAGTTVIIDEAFLDFTDRESLAGTPQTIVLRSLTKIFGLPGLRAGFVIAPQPFHDRIETARQPWNLGTPAARVGTHCLQAQTFVAETRKRVHRERDRVIEAISSAVTPIPSAAPFVLCDVGSQSVDQLLKTAREHGLILRDARTFRRLDNHIRVAIREPAENDRLIDLLTDD